MFDELSNKLDSVFRKLKGRGALNEKAIKESLREIRLVLLEADVNFKVVKSFLAQVEERALGQQVIKSITPGQQIVKIVHDELVNLLGSANKPISFSNTPPTVIMLVGLQGSGKTTTAGKLAKRFKEEGRVPLMVAADPYRPAAIDQLQTLGQSLSVSVYSDKNEKQVDRLAKNAVSYAEKVGKKVVLIDTAGRLHIDEDMMSELEKIKKITSPQEVLLVADGMTGQDAVQIAETFNSRLGLTGTILTKLDGDARGGAALSVHAVTSVPIKFIGVGEKLDGLEVFHPDRMASRILQMGDILTLVERAEDAIEVEEAEKLERKLRRQEKFTLEDFLSALTQIQKLGPLEQFLKLIPGVNSKMLKTVKVDPGRIKKIEAIILSMTKQERQKPNLLNGSRRLRIANGSGTSVQEINQLLNQFKQMEKMMKKFGSGKLPFAIPGMGGGFPL